MNGTWGAPRYDIGEEVDDTNETNGLGPGGGEIDTFLLIKRLDCVYVKVFFLFFLIREYKK